MLSAVLFTDIVESIASAIRVGDSAWRRVLAHHDRMVRNHMERYRGTEVKQTGDGFLATFDTPAQAVGCALAITEHAPEFGIEVRAGVHVGEIERLEGDIAGIGVHIAARIMAAAGPSEVLVSRTVRDHHRRTLRIPRPR